MRLVDIDKARKEYSNLTDLTMSDTTLLLTLFGVLDNAPTVEAILKADYEKRLKANLKAILVELQLEIEELKNEPHCCEHYVRGINNSSNIIQEKIDKLEENA